MLRRRRHLPAPIARAVAGRQAIVVRRATPEDAGALEALAQLTGRAAPRDPALVAEADGTLAAALPLGGGAPVVDPFVATVDVVALLEVRARQLAEAEDGLGAAAVGSAPWRSERSASSGSGRWAPGSRSSGSKPGTPSSAAR